MTSWCLRNLRPVAARSLWRQASDVTREQDGLADVGETQHLHQDALDAQPASAVGGHAELEGLEVGREVLGVEPPALDACLEQDRVVDALPTRDELDAAVVEVEATAQAGVHRAL